MIEQEELLSNPFPGLRAFEMGENYLFFGRDGQSDEVLSKLRGSRFVAVVGTSGSGKSSLVRAGLLPALFSGHMTSAGSSWRVALFRPGNSPVGNLAKAMNDPEVLGTGATENASILLANTETTLRRSSLGLIEIISQAHMEEHENLLIVVDQFEELFRFKQNSTAEHPEDEAAAFVRLLLESTRQKDFPIYIILTMRSDYLGECAHFWGLPEAINDGQYLIPRMTDDGRREAVTGPVIIGGGKITAPLVNRLLNDAGDDPAQLPILQHALMRTWDYWKGQGKASEQIDIPHYEGIGAMAHALSLHADEAYNELSEPLQKVAEKLFKSLTEKGAEGREVRRPATVGEICAVAEASEEDVKAVIEVFRRESRSFLMPPPRASLAADTLVDISHESLIRGWHRLRGWVDEEARSARIYRRLAETAVLHQKKEAGLWRDPDLQLALNWRGESRPNQAWAGRYHPDYEGAMKFLDESREARDREAAERARRRKKEQRRTYLFIAVLAAAFLVSSSLAAYAVQQAKKARWQEGQTIIALDKEKVATERLRIALGSANEAKETAQRAERQALKEKEAKESALVQEREALTQAQLASASEKKAKDAALIQQRKAEASSVKAMESEKSALTAKKVAVDAGVKAKDAIETIQYIDNSVPYSKAVLRGSRETVSRAVFSPDGTRAVAFSVDFKGLVWTANTAGWGTSQDEAINPTKLQGNTGNVLSAAFTPGGERIVAVSAEQKVLVWNAKTGECIDGITSSGDCRGRKLAGGDTPGDSALHTAYSTAISPDGQLAVSISHRVKSPQDSREGTLVTLLEIDTGRKIELKGKLGEVNTAAFSPDCQYVVTASDDATARVWKTTTGGPVKILNNPSGKVESARFSPDGRHIITLSGNSALIWDWGKDKDMLVGELKGHNNPITGVAFSGDGGLMATASNKEATTQVWQVATGKRIASLDSRDTLVTSVAFSPDPKNILVVTTNADRTVRLWELETRMGNLETRTGKSVRVLSGHASPATSVEFSRDGQYILTAGDRTARVWDGSRGYDFSALALEAKWVSGVEGGESTRLTFGGKEDDARGFALWRENTYMEDGSIPSGKALEMHPKWVQDKGFISGIYPAYTVEPGDYFKADFGFLKNAGAGEVTLQLRYIESDAPPNLENWGSDVLRLPMLEKGWRKKYSGNLISLDADLSSIAGRRVQFVLVVLTDGVASQDWATLVNPRIEKVNPRIEKR